MLAHSGEAREGSALPCCSGPKSKVTSDRKMRCRSGPGSGAEVPMSVLELGLSVLPNPAHSMDPIPGEENEPRSGVRTGPHYAAFLIAVTR